MMGLSGHHELRLSEKYNKWSEVDPGTLLGVDPEKFVTRKEYEAAIKTWQGQTKLSLHATMTGKGKYRV